MRLAVRGVLVAAALSLALPAAAANPAYEKIIATDAPGSRDHPWTGRYEGSTILLQSTAAYDEIAFPIGKAVGASYSDDKRFGRVWKAEGKITRTVYIAPEGRSSLEVLRNFQNHLQSSGWAVAWQCAGEQGCGESFKTLKYRWNDKTTHVRGQNIAGDRARFSDTVFDGAKDIRYVLMQKGRGPGSAYVGLYVAMNQGGAFGDISDALNNHVTALVEVLEPAGMEQKIVTVKADAISSELRADGSVSLYGLLFDTDKATLRADSKPQLDEMVKFLKSGSAKVYIVGHTDNQGALDYNLGLSDRRAKAVVQALVNAGVPANRLAGRGVGPLAPVASNGDESGRQKNRRVELILQ